MSEMKHTPGPWKVEIGDGDIEVVHRIGAVTTVVATIHGHNHLPVIIADAYMVAAAPQLLEACKLFVGAYEKSLQLEKTDSAVRMARMAIAAAEGES